MYSQEKIVHLEMVTCGNEAMFLPACCHIVMCQCENKKQKLF